jgi:hypothetical protein
MYISVILTALFAVSPTAGVVNSYMNMSMLVYIPHSANATNSVVLSFRPKYV